MPAEQEKTMQGLQTALQMERDGVEFYLKVSRLSTNEPGKRLFESLATEEEAHFQTFKLIYESISARKAWPSLTFQPDGGRGLRTIFARATGEMGTIKKAPISELGSVETAISMESKSYDYYENLARHAAYPGEREFYEALASQEREHHLILLDYFEYLKDPAAWFVKEEHPSLDAGS